MVASLCANAAGKKNHRNRKVMVVLWIATTCIPLVLLVFYMDYKQITNFFARMAVLESIRANGNVAYICGYNLSGFGRAVLHDWPQIRWDASVHTGATTLSDIMLASGASCNEVDAYNGKILYVDGESGRIPQTLLHRRNVYYLGPQAPRGFRGPCLKMYHVAHTTLVHPYSALDFLNIRPYAHRPWLLAYINTNCVRHREQAFDDLSQLARDRGLEAPHALGKCHGSSNDNFWNYTRNGGNRLHSVVEQLQNYRFALTMENSETPGYITEKIANAFIAGTIPVYFGTREIFEIFNERAFVFYDVHDPHSALDRIARLATNESEYRKVLSEPVLARGEETLREYFSLTDDVGTGSLKSRIQRFIGVY